LDFHGERQAIDACGNFTINSFDAAYKLMLDGVQIVRSQPF